MLSNDSIKEQGAADVSAIVVGAVVGTDEDSDDVLAGVQVAADGNVLVVVREAVVRGIDRLVLAPVHVDLEGVAVVAVVHDATGGEQTAQVVDG